MIDIEFFRSQGYVVVPNVVSEDLVDAVCEAVEKFCGVEFDDPLSWTFVTQKNGLPELTGAGMVGTLSPSFNGHYAKILKFILPLHKFGNMKRCGLVLIAAI